MLCIIVGTLLLLHTSGCALCVAGAGFYLVSHVNERVKQSDRRETIQRAQEAIEKDDDPPMAWPEETK